MTRSPTRAVINRVAVTAAATATLASAWRNWRTWRRQVKGTPSPAAAAVSPAWMDVLDLPSVSILVPAWNEANQIERRVRSFLQLTYPKLQLVLCAGGADGTFDLATRWRGERVIVLEQYAGEGKQRALRRSLDASSSDLIMLTDADCIFDDAAFEHLITPLVNGRADVVTGFSEPRSDERAALLIRYQWLVDRATIPDHDSRAKGVLGRNCAIRRSLLERLHAFDAPAATGTDYVLSMLLAWQGIEILAVQQSRIATRYPTTVFEYQRMWRRWIKNVIVHAPTFGARSEEIAAVEAIWLAWFTLLIPLTAPLFGRAALVVPLTFLAIGSMNRIRRIAVGTHLEQAAPSAAVLLAAPLMTIVDRAIVLLALYDYLRPDRRATWA